MLVALIVSVIALAVTTFQLSAQMFSTAEGQRKCSESLLSAWSKDAATKARWKWRWSEARYELIFVAPEICLESSASRIADERKDTPQKDRYQLWKLFRVVPGAGNNSKRKIESVLGSDSGLDYVLFMSTLADNAPDMVSWLSFLTFLRLETSDRNIEESVVASQPTVSALRDTSKHNIAALELLWPRVKYRIHSWDYMPPNAPKPFAKTTIHDIAVLIRRAGMVWKTFDPKNGNMSAEGGAHILTGSLIPGLGLVLEYRCLDDKLLADRVSQKISTIPIDTFTQSQMHALNKAQTHALGLDPEDLQKLDEESQRASERSLDQRDDGGRKAQRTWLWEKEMDKFVFGIVPGDPRLGFSDYPFVDVSDRINAVYSGFDSEARDKSLNFDWQCLFNDLMTIVPPVLKTRYSGRLQKLPFRGHPNTESVFDDTLSTFGTFLRAFLNGGTEGYPSQFEIMRQENSLLTEERFEETMIGQERFFKERTDGGTSQMKRVLGGVEDMTQKLAESYWFNDPAFLERMHDYHDSTTQYFIENRARFSIHELLRLFLFRACLTVGGVRRNERKGKYVAEYRGTGNWLCEPIELWRSSCILELYFTYIPYCIINMARHDPCMRAYRRSGLQPACSEEDVVIEAWLTLMWRGYLFRYLHFSDSDIESSYVPHQYCGSRLPVYMI